MIGCLRTPFEVQAERSSIKRVEQEIELSLRVRLSLVLTLRRRNIFGLSADVRIQNCCCCLDANGSVHSDSQGHCRSRIRPCYFRVNIKAFERILMTYSFLERIGQPAVDLANDREKSVPFNMLTATFILEFSSSQMFSMRFRDSLGSTETERNDLMLEDFS
nr:unnamed protein product [Brassica oleracea]